MFVNAIKEISNFTRPIHTITRTLKGIISPGASTFFFVNDQGDAITCKHVAELIIASDMVNKQFQQYKSDYKAIPVNSKQKEVQRQLDKHYNYKHETVVQIKNTFVNSVTPLMGLQFEMHPTLDLAIIRFQGFTSKNYNSHAVFVKDSAKIQQGRYLCRLGYPFPEFNNFKYDHISDEMEWTNTGNMLTPAFPIDGIITRFIAAPNGTGGQIIGGIEMSTPGLKGQSGGPLFDSDGLVYGMQSATMHLHLGFDLTNHEVISNGKKTFVSNSPFLHVGNCVHVDRIKEFLSQHNIPYYEA